MSIQIEIRNTHINDLINFYYEKQRAIKEQIVNLEIELSEINVLISQLKQRPVNTFAEEIISGTERENYLGNWPWVKKIAFAIKEAGKPITTKDIVNILEKLEPNAIPRKRAISSVSSTLSVKSGKYSDKKEFIKIPTDSGEFAYETWKEIKITATSHEKDHISIQDLPF
jgi:hypothetical protein